MTDLEQRRARALKDCKFMPDSWPERFVSSMVDHAAIRPKVFLSKKQSAWLTWFAWLFRKQLRQKGYAALVPAEMPINPKDLKC